MPNGPPLQTCLGRHVQNPIHHGRKSRNGPYDSDEPGPAVDGPQ